MGVPEQQRGRSTKLELLFCFSEAWTKNKRASQRSYYLAMPGEKCLCVYVSTREKVAGFVRKAKKGDIYLRVVPFYWWGKHFPPLWHVYFHSL